MDYDVIVELAQATSIPLEIWMKIRFYANQLQVLEKLKYPEPVQGPDLISDVYVFLLPSTSWDIIIRWEIIRFCPKLYRIKQCYDKLTGESVDYRFFSRLWT